MLTEAKGIPVGLAVAGANRHDMKLVWATVDSIPVERPAFTREEPQGLCLDKGYDFDEVRRTIEEFGFTAHIRSRGEEAQAIKREAGFKARRWVVERVHSWMNRFRRILIRWDKNPDNYIAFLHFACALIAFRARGWYERRFGSILLAIVVIILYGGLILGVLPARGLVSWEAHLFGLIAGVLAARSHRR